MLEGQIDEILFPLLYQMLFIYDIKGIEVAGALPKRKKGAAKCPTILVQKIFDRRVGSTKCNDDWHDYAKVMVHSESIFMESTFQVDGLGVKGGLTTSYIVNSAASIMRSDTARFVFNAAGMEILHVTDIRQNYFPDGKEDFLVNPSFDFVIAHNYVYARCASSIDPPAPIYITPK